MPGCISACSCVASPTPPEPKGPPKPKWIELKGYCVTCTHESDIRPPSEREDRRQRKIQAIELYWLGVSWTTWEYKKVLLKTRQ